MVEFSATTRLIAAVVFVLISAVAWWWLQRSTTKLSATTTLDKKKSEKKTKKKKKAEPALALEEDAQPSTQPAKEQFAAVSSAPASDSDDDSNDEDAGLSAKQILAKRRFKPKAIGGNSAPASTPGLVRFQAEQRVVARFQDGNDWFPGIVLEVRRGNEYHIKYDDGEVEYHVPHARIKDAAAAASANDKRTPSKRALVGTRSKLDPRLTADSSRSEADDEADSAGNDDVDSSSDDGDAGQESEDGWQVVGAAEAAAKKRRSAAAAAAVGADPVDAEGLTKRQREARRKKERKKELKEMVRAQNQEHGLHARWGGTMTRLKYVPPPTGSSPSS